MEPTLDPRLGDLLLDVAASRAKPRREFVLQSNGILLHRHDTAKLQAAGLSVLSLSIDSIDPAVMKELRGGTSLRKVLANVEHVRSALPCLRVHFIATVTRANLPGLESLVRTGLDIGVTHFVFREVFYHPDNDMVDHRRMPDLILEDGAFDRIASELIARFGSVASFDFADSTRLLAFEQRTLRQSLRQP
jgi:MoaA/NifB/PqqE/SkfB family radical SAM enzyme